MKEILEALGRSALMLLGIAIVVFVVHYAWVHF